MLSPIVDSEKEHALKLGFSNSNTKKKAPCKDCGVPVWVPGIMQPPRVPEKEHMIQSGDPNPFVDFGFPQRGVMLMTWRASSTCQEGEKDSRVHRAIWPCTGLLG